MKHFYVGIDGGGTKTKLVLQNAEGQELAQCIEGPANIRISVQNSYKSIMDAFHKALQISELTEDHKKYQFHVGMGIAGFDVAKCRDEFKALPFPFATCIMRSDSYVTCLGAHKGKDGALIIAGTGTVGIKLIDGEKFKIGGFGFPHGDEGSGAWLGLESVRRLLQMCDGRHMHSPMLVHLKKQLGVHLSDIVEWACFASPTDYARLAENVVHFSKLGDVVATDLIKNSALHIEKIYKLLVLDKKFKNKKLPCSFVGGLSTYIESYLAPKIRNHLTQPLGDPCSGAIFMLRGAALKI